MATAVTIQDATQVDSLVSGFDFLDRPVVGRVAGISRNLNNSIMFIEVTRPERGIVRLWAERDTWTLC